MANALELKVGRKNTRALIMADEVRVSLQRPEKEKTPAGGERTIAARPLPEQSFTITPLSGLVWDRSDPTPDEGLLTDVTHEMIGMHDADIRKGDWFEWDQDGLKGKYFVIHVSTQRRYRTSATLRFVDHKQGPP